MEEAKPGDEFYGVMDPLGAGNTSSADEALCSERENNSCK